MEKQIYGRGTRGKYHIAKEHEMYGYKAYCGYYIPSYDITTHKFGMVCKLCQKAYAKLNKS